jgi:hypothetical protein
MYVPYECLLRIGLAQDKQDGYEVSQSGTSRETSIYNGHQECYEKRHRSSRCLTSIDRGKEM